MGTNYTINKSKLKANKENKWRFIHNPQKNCNNLIKVYFYKESEKIKKSFVKQSKKGAELLLENSLAFVIFIDWISKNKRHELTEGTRSKGGINQNPKLVNFEKYADIQEGEQ